MTKKQIISLIRTMKYESSFFYFRSYTYTEYSYRSEYQLHSLTIYRNCGKVWSVTYVIRDRFNYNLIVKFSQEFKL